MNNQLDNVINQSVALEVDYAIVDNVSCLVDNTINDITLGSVPEYHAWHGMV